MKLRVFSARKDERELYEAENRPYGFGISYTSEPLGMENAALCRGFDAVQILTATRLDAALAGRLAEEGVRFVLARSAGYDHVDLPALEAHGLRAANVPRYSPEAIAEHTVMLMLMLLRHMRAQVERVGRLDFTMAGLRGRELASLTVGLYGTGHIGGTVARLLHAFGATVQASSRHERPELRGFVQYVPWQELLETSDILSFHCPLTEQTRRLVDTAVVARMKDGVLLVNTARGGLFDFPAVLGGLRSGRIAGVGLDVYENENRFIRKNIGAAGLDDPVLAELLRMQQVIFTPHVGFYTEESVRELIRGTLENLREFAAGGGCRNELTGRAGD